MRRMCLWVACAALGCGEAKDRGKEKDVASAKPTDTAWTLTLSDEQHGKADHSVISVAKYGDWKLIAIDSWDERASRMSLEVRVARTEDENCWAD